MDEVNEFLVSFLDAEWALRRAYCTERDDNEFRNLNFSSFRLFVKGSNFSMVTPRSRRKSEEFFARKAQQLEMEDRRSLFQIKTYKHSIYGELYRAYVGKHHRGHFDSYEENLYAARFDGKLKMFARSRMCPDCTSLGQVSGARCVGCSGRHSVSGSAPGWLWFKSSPIDLEGPPVAVQKLQAPELEGCIQEYESE